ncbi:MAG: hypothetical protein CL613_00605, partial [Aquimarina sp.]|nr:hypothetical protein [Aquimarina sp.]
MCKKSIIYFLITISIHSYAQHNILSLTKVKSEYTVLKPDFKLNLVHKDIQQNFSDKHFKKIALKRFWVRDSLGVMVKRGINEQENIFIFDTLNNILEEKIISHGKLNSKKIYDFLRDSLIKREVDIQYGFRYKGSIDTIKTYYEYFDDKIIFKKYNVNNELTDEWLKQYDSSKNLIVDSHKTYRFQQEASKRRIEYLYNNENLIERKEIRINKIFKSTREWKGKRDYKIKTELINGDLVKKINTSGNLTKFLYDEKNKIK